MKHETAVYKKTVFENGLKVITEAIPHVRSISLGLWLNTGSRDESGFINGVSHFIEHMVFKGTKSRNASEIASYLEAVGGILNAFTSREQTCFYARILDQHLTKAMELLFDLVRNPLFDKGDIEKEKKVVLEELKDIEDNPSDLVHDLFSNAIFGRHSLGRSIMGTRTTVNGMSKTRIVNYVDKHYRPNRMIVAASGNLEHAQLVELTKNYTNTMQNGKIFSNRKEPGFFDTRKVHHRKIKQVHICMGVPGKKFLHPSRHAIMLLNAILGGGMSSRLFQQLRENMGLVYSVYTYLDFFEDSSVFGFYLGTDKKNVRKAMSAIKDELTKIRNNNLPGTELDKAKEQLKGSLMLGLESTSNRMNRLAKHELLTGRYIDLDETIRAIDAVKGDDVIEAARELLMTEKISAAALGPIDKQVFSVLE